MTTPKDEVLKYHISRDDLHRMGIEDTAHGVTLHKRAGFRHLCEAAGGVPMQPKGQWACLRRDQFVRLP